jgi:hypothetical protein
MSESRRLRNDRLKKELRVALKYPNIQAGLKPMAVKMAKFGQPSSM